MDLEGGGCGRELARLVKYDRISDIKKVCPMDVKAVTSGKESVTNV